MAFEAYLAGTRRRVCWPAWWLAGVASMALHLAAAGLLARALAAQPAAGRRPVVAAPSGLPAGGGGVIIPVRIAGHAYRTAADGPSLPAPPQASRTRKRRPPVTALGAPPPIEPPPVVPPPIDVRPVEQALPAPVVAAPPATEAAPNEQLPGASARGLRVYETYPSLPRGLPRGGRSYLVAVEICVGASGAVEQVHLQRGAAAALDDVVLSAIKTWRYRPYTVGGSSRAFCHSMRIVYKTG
jgi:TonB family protein